MCYILAKNVNNHGCVAWKTKPGKELGTLKNVLENLIAGKHIQIVTISGPMVNMLHIVLLIKKKNF